jgi:hypothetical protein
MAMPTLAQRDYTVVKPRERAASEKIAVTRKATQASKGVIAVLIDPYVPSQVTVTDAKGKVIEQAQTDAESARVDFELRRGQTYLIKASAPGYTAAERKSKLVKGSEIVRLQLRAQFARVDLPGLPQGAQVFFDDKLVATTDKTGRVALDSLTPGTHSLLIRHPEYNDYKTTLDNLEAGTSISFFSLSTILTKVARLTIQSLPNAIVLIDNAYQGRVGPDGSVRIDYELEQSSEHIIRVELPGYQPWEGRQLLTPGARAIEIKLNPIVTSTGMTDGFDSLSLWSHPPEWKFIREKINERQNNKLQVGGEQLGLLKDKLYRDFTAVFNIWLSDGKGATWTLRADKEGRNYYLFHLAGPRSGELAPHKLYTYRCKDGVLSEVNAPTPLLFDLKEREGYFIEITVRGNTVAHKISNANAELSEAFWTDTDAGKDQFLYGYFGFRSFKGETFQIDDFTIDPAPAREQN